MAFSVTDLTNIFSTIGSNVAGGISAMTPTQLATTFSTITSALGPSTAEQILGKDLDLYAKFAVKGFAGDAASVMYATNIQIAIMGITGLPSNVANVLPMVWAAKDEAMLAMGIAQVKNAAGL